LFRGMARCVADYYRNRKVQDERGVDVRQ
jgi:hypothetical protein